MKQPKKKTPKKKSKKKVIPIYISAEKQTEIVIRIKLPKEILEDD